MYAYVLGSVREYITKLFVGIRKKNTIVPVYNCVLQ